MKRIRIMICVLLSILITSVSLLIGCGGAHDEFSDKNKSNNDLINITLYGENGESAIIGVDPSGDNRTLTEFYKPNYYLSGFFNSPMSSVQYIDKEGYFLHDIEMLPATLYAHFLPVTSDLKFEKSGLWPEPVSLKSTTRYFYFQLPKHFVNAAKANPQLELELMLTFTTKDIYENAKTSFMVVDSDKNSNEIFYKVEFNKQSITYESRNISCKFPARALSNGGLWLGFGRINANVGYMKNLSFVLKYTGGTI